MQEHGLLLSIFDASDIGLVLVNEDGRVALWNDWIAQMSGLTADQAVGQSLLDCFGKRLGIRVSMAVNDALQRGVSSILSTALDHRLFPLVRPDARGGPPVRSNSFALSNR